MSGPNEFILDSDQPAKDVTQHFASQLDLLRSLVSYGSSLLPRCLRSSSRELVDAVALGALLKHFIAMLDAADILIRQGAVYPTALNLRSMFEVSIYLEWMLREDQTRRARSFSRTGTPSRDKSARRTSSSTWSLFVTS